MSAASSKHAFGYVRDPLFLISLALYGCNQLWIKPHLHHYSPFFHGHLDDCLLVPVALPLYLLVYRQLGLRPDDAPPRWWEVTLHLVVWCPFFKWFGPVVLHRSQADPWDILCYTAGGAVAWAFWNWRPQRSVQSSLGKEPSP